MTTIAIRQRLYEYIRFADEKKVKAIYTMIEEEVNEKRDIWTQEFIQRMENRAGDLVSGKAKGRSSEDVLKKAELLLSKKK